MKLEKLDGLIEGLNLEGELKDGSCFEFTLGKDAFTLTIKNENDPTDKITFFTVHDNGGTVMMLTYEPVSEDFDVCISSGSNIFFDDLFFTKEVKEVSYEAQKKSRSFRSSKRRRKAD